MIKIKKTIALMSIFLILSSGTLWADDKIKKTQITGKLNMNIEVGKINNIINNSSSSRATISIGAVKKSIINGNVNFNKIKVNNIKNEINNSSNSLAKIEVGVIKNSDIKGQSKIEISAKKDIKNTVSGGINNRAKIVIGGVDDGDDDGDDNNNNGMGNDFLNKKELTKIRKEAIVKSSNIKNNKRPVENSGIILNIKSNFWNVSIFENDNDINILQAIIESRKDLQKLMSHTFWAAVKHPFDGAGDLNYDVSNLELNISKKEAFYLATKLFKTMVTHGPNNAISYSGYTKWSDFSRQKVGNVPGFFVNIKGPENGVIIPMYGINKKTGMPMLALQVVNTLTNEHAVTGMRFITMEEVRGKNGKITGWKIVNRGLSRSMRSVGSWAEKGMKAYEKKKGDFGGDRGPQIANWEALLVGLAKDINSRGYKVKGITSRNYIFNNSDNKTFTAKRGVKQVRESYRKNFTPKIDDVEDYTYVTRPNDKARTSVLGYSIAPKKSYKFKNIVKFIYDPDSKTQKITIYRD